MAPGRRLLHSFSPLPRLPTLPARALPITRHNAALTPTKSARRSRQGRRPVLRVGGQLEIPLLNASQSPTAHEPTACKSDNGGVKSFRKELWFEVPGRRAFLNITREVEECLRESGVKEGLVLINAMHITASVFINDDEPGLLADYEKWLEGLAPHEPTSQYRHNRTGEDNADAHLKRQVMGREVVVAVTGGKLD